ncbi:HET-domain-containing protein, partial [Thozetella sp. PMI_491]
MRLLHTSTLELTTFQRECPPYAILSHTWEANEPPFEIFLPKPRWLRRLSLLGKRKYPKVIGACALARSKGYEWVWIDTCCIDKSSSAELSEAINSMFKWYQKARVCYAYLVDIPHVPRQSPDSSQVTLTDEAASALAGARWFTRGWTLQELIAPSEVEFYDAAWSLVGTKSSLAPTLEEITGIPAGMFSNAWRSLCAGGLAQQSLHLASVAQRLSWAAGRETTRAEDMAYCLMGLFDVNLPLLYGEGLAKAFTRLQAEIARNTNDQSLFAWG